MDVRQELKEIVGKAQALHQTERRISIQSVYLVCHLDHRNAAVNMGMSTEAFARYIGLTPSRYWKRVQAARVICRFPEAREMVEAGETEVSHLALIAPKLTEANARLIFDWIKGKSKREVEGFLSRVTLDGRLLDKEPEIELRITLTQSQAALLERAREVLAHLGHVPSSSEIVVKALDDLLEKRDPMRKAERAEARREKKVVAPELPSPGKESQRSSSPRPAVPAAVRHAVWLRDEGQCTWSFPGEGRCPERAMLELDHIEMWCRGGMHTVENLTLRCRRHNQYAAGLALGATSRPTRTSPRDSCAAGRYCAESSG